jgi:hypothetical protein
MLGNPSQDNDDWFLGQHTFYFDIHSNIKVPII